MPKTESGAVHHAMPQVQFAKHEQGQMRQSFRLVFACLTVVLATSLGFQQRAEARLTRITAGAPTTINLPVFGATGPYLKIAGTFQGEIDPADRRNVVIADINLAPQTGGKVQYTSTFFILRPVDLSKSNGKLFYDSGNRGNKRILQWFNDGAASDNPTTAADFGNGFLMRQGYIVALNGYSADVTPSATAMSITLPVAVNPDGSSITGSVVAESIPSAATGTTLNLPYAANSTDPTNGVLTVREHALDSKVVVTGWSYVNNKRVSFPGPAKVQWIYEFVYTAKDPIVMGMGHAATRDFLSFLKHATVDDFGNPNPVAMPGGLRAIYQWGRSNGGRHARDFVRWGFNEDENGSIVFDGVMPYATGSGGHQWANFRFSQPTVSQQGHSRHFSREYEFPHTLPVITDPLTGQTDGILRRCLANNTCPKYFNIDSANEYWNKSNSLNHTDSLGNDLAPIETLAPNARLYFIASIQHNTTFDSVAAAAPACQQLTNPLYNGPVFRALSVALDQWVSFGTLPPPSVVPHRNDGTLVPPEQVKFPKIPATHYAGWPSLTAVVFNPKTMSRNAPLDFSVVPYQPLPGPEYTVQVPQVDTDGNDIAGIRLPALAVPTGTYNGWAVLRPGAGAPDICGQLGQFIPFANTTAERIAAGDPRPSVEERYPSFAEYYSEVIRAIDGLVKDRFMLCEDADDQQKRLLQAGLNAGVSPPHGHLPPQTVPPHCETPGK
jgi:hypothetical protein